MSLDTGIGDAGFSALQGMHPVDSSEKGKETLLCALTADRGAGMRSIVSLSS